MKVILGSICSLGLVTAVLVQAPGAQAKPNCPPATIGGRTVAWIEVGATKVPIKAVRFTRGQPLHPPDTNQAAGLSLGHAPLSARDGTTVLTWHVRFGPGCYGTLNSILKQPIGTTFTVQAVGRQPKTYQITDRHEVRKGRYRAAWFRQTGPHQMALFTCAELRGGQFRNTSVIIAEPVSGDVVPSPPDPQVAVAAPPLADPSVPSTSTPAG